MKEELRCLSFGRAGIVPESTGRGEYRRLWHWTELGGHRGMLATDINL